MNVYNSFDEIEYMKDTVITVGTYDGVHRGHRKILNEMIEYRNSCDCRDLVITLHPHPQIVLHKKDRKPLKLLNMIDERLELFEKFGIKNVLVLPFTPEFARTSPKEFIVDHLIKKVGMRKMYIGFDHNFGKDRQGDSQFLKDLSEEYDFETKRVGPLMERDLVISSTKIRNALYNNDLDKANEMLGYYYLVKGDVAVGAKRGRDLGYPTANIHLPDPNKLLPDNGVYFVGAYVKGKMQYGMANLGIRPTFTNDKVPTLEVHFFDYDEDIYGERLTVHFLKFIRPEMHFVQINHLIEQIGKDEKKCRSMIKDFSF